MHYSDFLDRLKTTGWAVPSKSFACRTYGEEWQVAFIRIGGRHQLPGQVSFVICIRHATLRDREKERHEIVKDPHDYPFKLTLEDLASDKLQYNSRLLHYDLSSLGIESDWSLVFAALNDKIPKKIVNYTKTKLRAEILQYGSNGYVERIWVEDLMA